MANQGVQRSDRTTGAMNKNPAAKRTLTVKKTKVPVEKLSKKGKKVENEWLVDQ